MNAIKRVQRVLVVGAVTAWLAACQSPVEIIDATLVQPKDNEFPEYAGVVEPIDQPVMVSYNPTGKYDVIFKRTGQGGEVPASAKTASGTIEIPDVIFSRETEIVARLEGQRRGDNFRQELFFDVFTVQKHRKNKASETKAFDDMGLQIAFQVTPDGYVSDIEVETQNPKFSSRDHGSYEPFRAALEKLESVMVRSFAGNMEIAQGDQIRVPQFKFSGNVRPVLADELDLEFDGDALWTTLGKTELEGANYLVGRIRVNVDFKSEGWIRKNNPRKKLRLAGHLVLGGYGLMDPSTGFIVNRQIESEGIFDLFGRTYLYRQHTTASVVPKGVDPSKLFPLPKSAPLRRPEPGITASRKNWPEIQGRYDG